MDKLRKEAIAELRSVRDFIRWGASRFSAAGMVFGHGTDNAWDEASVLVLEALHLPPDIHAEAAGAVLTECERREVVALLVRRVKERLPAPYLTHEAWFAGIPFTVDERVLIPRSPIAEPIRQGFSPWLDETPLEHILDLGTGCGCIAIACALAFPQAEVDAVDVSADALEVTRMNILRHHMEDRVHAIRSDLYAALDERRYDLIVSNPPYVSKREMDALPPEYGHEPELGLAGGYHGLDIVVRILAGAHAHLHRRGALIVEVGNSQGALEQRFPHVPFTWLEFEHGGHGVFLLYAEQLQQHQHSFDQARTETPS